MYRTEREREGGTEGGRRERKRIYIGPWLHLRVITTKHWKIYYVPEAQGLALPSQTIRADCESAALGLVSVLRA